LLGGLGFIVIALLLIKSSSWRRVAPFPRSVVIGPNVALSDGPPAVMPAEATDSKITPEPENGKRGGGSRQQKLGIVIQSINVLCNLGGDPLQ